MQIHQIKREHKNKKKRIVGRGGRRGKTAGRGTKGQNARAGHKKRPEMRDKIKKLPKLRGYHFKSIQDKPRTVNIEVLEKNFNAGEVVSPETLLAKGLISRTNGKVPKVKILGTGALSKKFKVQKCLLSATAKATIEKAGGEVTL